MSLKKISLFDFGVGQVLTFDPLFQGRAENLNGDVVALLL
jgi:hypothetical protein